MASSVSFFGDIISRERRQLATTFARPRSCRQSSMESRARVMRGSLGTREREAVVRRMVHAKRVFLAQGRAVSDSLRWAWERMVRKRWRQPRIRSWLVVDCEEVVEVGELRLWRKRLKTGKAWGTTLAWQAPVLSMLAKMWRMLAWRSALIIEGKISDASTRASREFWIR